MKKHNGVFVIDKGELALRRMSKDELMYVIHQYEALVSNLNNEILCLKYALFFSTPSLSLKTVMEDIDSEDLTSAEIPSLGRKIPDVSYQ